MVEMGQEDITAGQQLADLVGGRHVAARCLLLFTAFALARLFISRISKPAGSKRLAALLFEPGTTARCNEVWRGRRWPNKRRCARQVIPPAG